MSEGTASLFAVPSEADSSAGARFFEQHFRDLTWSVGYEIVARDIEDFTASMSETMRKSTGEPPSGMSVERYAEAVNLAARSVAHKGTFARTVVTRNTATVLETTLCRYVDNFLCYLADLLTRIFHRFPAALVASDATISVRDVFQHGNLESLQV